MAALKRLEDLGAQKVGDWHERPAFAKVDVAACKVVHERRLTAVAWSAAGGAFAAASEDKTASLWALDPRGGSGGGGGGAARETARLRGHHDHVCGVRWDPANEAVLATASLDKSVRLWDARTGKQAASVELGAELAGVEWSPNGQRLIVFADQANRSGDTLLFVLDARMPASARARRTAKYPHAVNALAFAPAGGHVFVASARTSRETGLTHGTVDVLEFTPGGDHAPPVLRAARSLLAHPSPVQALAVTPHGGGLLASGGDDCLAQLWGLRDLACARGVTHLPSPICALAFSHDGAYLATAMTGASVTVSSAATGEFLHKNEVVQQMPTNDTDIMWDRTVATSVAWHPSRHILLAALDRDAYRREPMVVSADSVAGGGGGDGGGYRGGGGNRYGGGGSATVTIPGSNGMPHNLVRIMTFGALR
ncbi:WD40-repeat-containing domain protein [Tribonema minus]|uniref:WD40-repeat-containing domain protein n=1 Tax=Tribonema minus TaxID=303371 RepID=A0A835ZG62_9STRA|nr:WD40-repeat-containing domain protein [Tribonema minus]